MTSNRLSFVDLPWLPRLSADFRPRLAAIEEDLSIDWGVALPALAQQAFGLNQALALSRALKRLHARCPTKALTPFKLGLLSNATVDFIVPFLEATALRYGIDLEVVSGPFGQPVQSALDAASAINACRPEAVLLALDHRGLPFRQ